MSYGKAVRDELRVPTRELRHAIPQVYAGYKELHDSALAAGSERVIGQANGHQHVG